MHPVLCNGKLFRITNCSLLDEFENLPYNNSHIFHPSLLFTKSAFQDDIFDEGICYDIIFDYKYIELIDYLVSEGYVREQLSDNFIEKYGSEIIDELEHPINYKSLLSICSRNGYFEKVKYYECKYVWSFRYC